MSQELGEGAYPHYPSSPIEAPCTYPPPEPIEIDDSFGGGDNKSEGNHDAHISSDRMREGDTIRSDRVATAEPDLFLAKFTHLDCPRKRPCHSFLSVDLGPILRRRCDDPDSSSPSSRVGAEPPSTARARHRQAFKEAMCEAFERNGADLVLHHKHPPGEKRSMTADGDMVVTSTKAVIRKVRVLWGGIPDHDQHDENRNHILERGYGRTPNLLAMGDLRTVQWQLELVRRRGYRDLFVVQYKTSEYTKVYPASPRSLILGAEEEGRDDMDGDNNDHRRTSGGNGGGHTDVSSSLGVGPGDGTRAYPVRYEFSGIRTGNRDDYDEDDLDDDNDARMNSSPHPPRNLPPTLCPPPDPRVYVTSASELDGIIQTTTKDLDDILDLEQEGPRYRGHSPSVGPSGVGGLQQGEGKHAEPQDDGYYGPDSQGQIW